MNTEEELQEIKKRIVAILGVSENYSFEEIEKILVCFKNYEEQFRKMSNDFCNLSNDFSNLESELQEIREKEKGNFFVYNARRDVPNKVYKSKQQALEDAKKLAYKEVNPIFVLRLETLIIPKCELQIHDISEAGIPDKYLNQYDSVAAILSEEEIPF